jgi:hypothetical protein
VRCPLFERAAVYEFVQVDGVLPRDDVLEGGAGLAAGLLLSACGGLIVYME